MKARDVAENAKPPAANSAKDINSMSQRLLNHGPGADWNCMGWLAAAAVVLLSAGITSCTHFPTLNQAKLIGCLWFVSPDAQPGRLDLNRVELDAIEDLGMRLVVLNGPMIGQPIPPGTEDPAEKLFAEGDRRQLQFFVDTGAQPNWWVQPDSIAELARARARIQLLHRRYGHHPSFHGFYVPYETYMMWGAQSELTATLYREAAAACKAVAPNKPVMISPFFILDDQQVLGDFRWATPQEFADFWAAVLRGSAVDIVALQDRGEHLSYYTDEQCAPFFAAMKRACAATGKKLWANVETGELAVDSPADYVARFGRKTHVNDPRTQPYWRGVSAEKLAAKLRFVRAYSSIAITWGYREFVRPASGRDATNLYHEYRDTLIQPRTGHMNSR